MKSFEFNFVKCGDCYYWCGNHFCADITIKLTETELQLQQLPCVMGGGLTGV